MRKHKWLRWVFIGVILWIVGCTSLVVIGSGLGRGCPRADNYYVRRDD